MELPAWLEDPIPRGCGILCVALNLNRRGEPVFWTDDNHQIPAARSERRQLFDQLAEMEGSFGSLLERRRKGRQGARLQEISA